MITHYYRPKTMDEALKILLKPNTCPLGGGTTLNRSVTGSLHVIDLQSLGLDRIQKSGDRLVMGATVKIQSLLESAYTPEALKASIKLEAPLNLRNMMTIAGTLVTCNGGSPLAVNLLALDAILTIVGHNAEGRKISHFNIGNFLPLRTELLQKKMITRIEIPSNIALAFDSVARTPADKPIVSVSIAHWQNGRTRLVVGGWGKNPSLVMDGTGMDGWESAIMNACHESGDHSASSEYRCRTSLVLAQRCWEKIQTV